MNYFPDDDPEKQPIFTWRSHANLLYRNWINYVYQTTPYEFERIPEVVRELREHTEALLAKGGIPTKF